MHGAGKGPHRGRCGALPSMQRQKPMGQQRLWRLLPELRLLAAAPAFVFLIRGWQRRKPRRRWIKQKL